MCVRQGGMLSSKQQLFLSVLCCQVYKNNSRSSCTDRRKHSFRFMFSSYGNCAKLLPHKFSVLIHHLWTCLCNGTSLWSDVCTVSGLSLNCASHPSLSVGGGRCLWTAWFWPWHEWLPKHANGYHVKSVLLIRANVLPIPRFSPSRLSTWGIRMLLLGETP